jgi:hypothetical protein
MNITDHEFHFFVTLTCAFLMLERLVQGALDFSRWIKRRAAYKADAEYAEMWRIEGPTWDQEFLS